jgi:hypothetical protein
MKSQSDDPLASIRAQIHLAMDSHHTQTSVPVNRSATVLENLTQLIDAGSLQSALNALTEEIELSGSMRDTTGENGHSEDTQTRAAAGIRKAIRELESVLDILEGGKP